MVVVVAVVVAIVVVVVVAVLGYSSRRLDVGMLSNGRAAKFPSYSLFVFLMLSYRFPAPPGDFSLLGISPRAVCALPQGVHVGR